MKQIAWIIVGLIFGWILGFYQEQSVNSCIDAGFIVIDPDGYEVDRFDRFFGFFN